VSEPTSPAAFAPERAGVPAPTAVPAISPALFGALTVAATGGPLALAAVYLPGVLGDARDSTGLVGLVAVAFFAPVFAIWWGYSTRIVSAGGLTAFVEAAAGRRVATVQAAVWVTSYLLYLVYTAAYLAYDLLPEVFPSTRGYGIAFELGLPVAIAAVALLPIRRALLVVAALVAGQLAVTVALASAAAGTLGTPVGSFVGHGNAPDIGLAAGNASLLFVCASLPLFLGSEVAGGSAGVRRGLGAGFVVAAAVVVAATFPLSAAAPAVLATPQPGVTVAAASSSALRQAVGAGVVTSVVLVMVAEFLALSRLVHHVSRRPVRTISRWLAATMLGGAALAAIRPLTVYHALLKPSLVALWLAQFVVFAAYPLYARRHRSLTATTVALSVAACAFAAFGLYSSTANVVAS
jgi:hypothetical protein